MKLLPNFPIVGAAKSANTSTHNIFNQHPNIFMCDWKETSLFSFYNIKLQKYSRNIDVKFCQYLKNYN